MALPYATEKQLESVKKELEKKIQAGGGVSCEIPTKLSQLTNDTGFITETALTDYALKSELPDTSDFALKSEIPDVSEFVKESELPDFATFALKTELPDVSTFITSADLTPYALKTEIPEVDGFATKVDVDNLIKTEDTTIQVGNAEHGINLNGNADRVTYKGSEELAFVSDLEWKPVICNMNFRTLADRVYTQEEIFAWFFVEDIFELKNTIIKHPIYLRYGISLSTNPMYYYIPCQYVAFTDANTVEMITDGLDTKNDKFSRYHITIKLDGTVIKGASNIKVELKENVFVPDLPEDADTKTYQLKAVNGTLTWVE